MIYIHQHLFHGAFALAPWLRDHAGKSLRSKSHLKGLRSLRKTLVYIVHLVGEQGVLLDRRVRRSLHDSENHALILSRCRLLCRHQVKRHRQADDQECHDTDHRPIAERPTESVGITRSQPVKSARDPSRKSTLRHTLLEEL